MNLCQIEIKMGGRGGLHGSSRKLSNFYQVNRAVPKKLNKDFVVQLDLQQSQFTNQHLSHHHECILDGLTSWMHCVCNLDALPVHPGYTELHPYTVFRASRVTEDEGAHQF